MFVLKSCVSIKFMLFVCHFHCYYCFHVQLIWERLNLITIKIVVNGRLPNELLVVFSIIRCIFVGSVALWCVIYNRSKRTDLF